MTTFISLFNYKLLNNHLLNYNPNKTANGFWEDSTRLPEFYDGTYQYLKSLGLEEI